MAKVMIVDDHKDITDSISQIVEKNGHTALVVHNGKAFLDSVQDEKPDVVLLDVMMPGLTTKQILDGLIKKGCGDLKVIIVTVVRFADEEIDDLMQEYNIIDYVIKPFDIQDLMAKINKAVE